jgi:nitrogen fixation NifU-like protein
MSTVTPYLATVVEHYRRPHNQRALASPTHVHEGVSPLCGDRVRIELEVRDGAVVDAAFAASACAIATASASLLTDRVRGGVVADALRIDDEAAVAALGSGVPAGRRGCAILPLHVLRQALGRDV